MNSDSQETQVVVVGAGIIGLINALQYARRNIDVVLIDNLVGHKRSYKVGESLLVFSNMFLRTVGGLDEHLMTESFPKHGIWFTYGMEGRSSFEQRSEWGLETFLPSAMKDEFGSPKLMRCISQDCQIVRPEIEDVLLESARKHPRIRVLDTGVVRDVVLGSGSEQHQVSWECKQTGAIGKLAARWVIDCSGRNRFLARKFDHVAEGPILSDGFQTTAVWAQFDRIDDSQFKEWGAVFDDGVNTRRDLNTLHVWGDHYWIWVIRLSKGRISIGATYDQRHSPEGKSFRDKFWNLMRRYPIFDGVLSEENLLEFRSYKNVQHLTDTFVSRRRYAMAGDAASIIDAYYSQGMSLAFVTSWHVANIAEADLRQGVLDGEYIDRVNVSTRADWQMMRNMLTEKYTTAIKDGRFFLLTHLADMAVIGAMAIQRLRLARWLIETEGDCAREDERHLNLRLELSRRLFYSRSTLWSFVSSDSAQKIQAYFQRKIGERARWRIEHGMTSGAIRCIMRPRLAGLAQLWRLPGARSAAFVDISPKSRSKVPSFMRSRGDDSAPPALIVAGQVAAAMFLVGYAYDWVDTQLGKAALAIGWNPWKGRDDPAVIPEPSQVRVRGASATRKARDVSSAIANK